MYMHNACGILSLVSKCANISKRNSYLLMILHAVVESALIKGQIGPKSSSDIKESRVCISIELKLNRTK